MAPNHWYTTKQRAGRGYSSVSEGEFSGSGTYRVVQAYKRGPVARPGNGHRPIARPQLATLQKLARYRAINYDWRKVEARLNALPNFVTEIDGLDIHFIHVRSKHKNALPLIVTHGWPGSVIEQLKIVDPLTNPTAHGGSESDAFDVVIPSIPGYGFSGKPTIRGWDPAHIARAWVVLMKRLGFTEFVAQGGDWGAIITDVMATQGHPELLGIHSNMPGIFSADIDRAALSGARRHPVSPPTKNWLNRPVDSHFATEKVLDSPANQ